MPLVTDCPCIARLELAVMCVRDVSCLCVCVCVCVVDIRVTSHVDSDVSHLKCLGGGMRSDHLCVCLEQTSAKVELMHVQKYRDGFLASPLFRGHVRRTVQPSCSR